MVSFLVIRSEVGGNRLAEVIDYKQLDTWKEKVDPHQNEFSGTFVLLDDQHLNSKVYGLCLHMIDLARIILSEPQLAGIVTYGLVPLTRILSHYLLMTSEEISTWASQHNQYLADDENEYDTSNIKVLTLQTFNSLIERFEDDAIKCLMAIVDGHLFNFEDKEMKSIFLGILKRVPGPMQMTIKALNLEDLFEFNLPAIFGQAPSLFWKRREAALLILGKFSTDIVGSYAQEDKGKVKTLIDSLISIISEKNLNPIGILKLQVLGRDLWTIGEIIDSITDGSGGLESTLVTVFELSCYYVGSQLAPVRIMAAQTLRHSSEKILKSKVNPSVKVPNHSPLRSTTRQSLMTSFN